MAIFAMVFAVTIAMECAWLNGRCIVHEVSKQLEKQGKKFKKGVAMEVESEYVARPQFRGSLGFAG